MLVHKGLEVGRNLLPTQQPIVQDAESYFPVRAVLNRLAYCWQRSWQRSSVSHSFQVMNFTPTRS